MDRDELYILPVKRKSPFNRKRFVLWCIGLSLILLLAVDAILFIFFSSGIGIIPMPMIIVMSNLFYVVGISKYIYKHDFAHGESYEKYQVINAMIYGIQDVLRVLLFLLLLNIFIVPIYSIVLIVILLGVVHKVFGGTIWHH